MTRNEKGFTLIELMIVIAIIGILAAIAIPQFSAYRTRGYNAGAESQCRNVATSLEAYFVDNDTYVGASTADGGNLATTYGLTVDPLITVTPTLAADAYTITAVHTRGDRTYTLTGPGGQIQ